MRYVQFEGGISRHGNHGVNYMLADGFYAEIPLPDARDILEGDELAEFEEMDEYYQDKWYSDHVSDVYGYKTMKRAILTELAKRGLPTDDIAWWYSEDEEKSLEEDADVDEPVLVEIDEEE